MGAWPHHLRCVAMDPVEENWTRQSVTGADACSQYVCCQRDRSGCQLPRGDDPSVFVPGTVQSAHSGEETGVFKGSYVSTAVLLGGESVE